MLRRILCFACVLFGGFFASACVETVPWADPVQCEEAGCTAENRECTALNRFEVVCGKCIDGFEQRGGECLPTGLLQSCEDLDCGEQHRSCDAQANADAQCGACVDGYVEENGACRPRTPCEQNAGICGEGNCIDTDDNYLCECFEGFKFDGTACVDVDECTLFDDLCEEREICINTLGSYTCECEVGLLPSESGCQPQVVDMAAGSGASCAIVVGGELYCWGHTGHGKLGIGEQPPGTIVPPTLVEGNHRWRSIQISSVHTCGITTDNDLYCWGYALDGRLGIGSGFQLFTTPRLVQDGYKWLTLSLGRDHSCGITEDFKLYCWGENTAGQVHTPADSPRPMSYGYPTLVREDLQWVNVGTSVFHSIGLTDTNVLYAWGANRNNILGTEVPPVDHISLPTSIANANYPWSAIASGDSFICGISEGNLYCWGESSSGQLGLGPQGDTNVPTRVGDKTGWTHIRTNSTNGLSICALENGTAYCWGQTVYGDDNTVQILRTPTPLNSNRQWSSIYVGGNHGCGISEGVAYCWGSSTVGQTGHDVTNELLTPAPVQFFP